MPDANRDAGDPKLIALFDKYGGRLVSPGGAAALLGLSRQTVHTLCKRGELRAFRSDEDARSRLLVTDAPTEQRGVEGRQRAGVRRLDRGAPPHSLRSRQHARQCRANAAAEESDPGRQDDGDAVPSGMSQLNDVARPGLAPCAPAGT